MRPFSYIRARTPEEAVSAFAQAGDGARYIAGGTTLYDLMKLDIEHPAHPIDVAEIDGLNEVGTGGDTLRFGALARMADVAVHPVILRDYPVLAESLWLAASQQLRNMATVGGNLLQRTRCPYFRHGLPYPCNKRAPGSGCAARGGLDRGNAILGGSDACVAVYPGDWAVALIALDASVETLGSSGRRTLRLADLHRLPEDRPDLENTLEPGEMITAITVPQTRAGRLSTYLKIRDRESYAFALVSAAVALELEGNLIRDVRIARGGVGTKPWRAPEAERALIGQRFDDGVALAAGRAAFAGAVPGRDNRFKAELGARAVADALRIAIERNAA